MKPLLADVHPTMPAPFAIAGVRLVRRLAVGGMAELFLGEQTVATGTRPVVVKCPLPGADAAWRAMMRRERDTLAKLDSPHIVRLLDRADAADGSPLLVLEYVDGPDLGALLAHLAKRGKRLPLPAAVAIIEALALGLEALHSAVDPATGRALELVHRDINPTNVLISRATGAVKLADLGVVRVGVGDGATLGGALKGTLAYMAPEQLAGAPFDHRADLYAAGLVAYELVCGVAARPSGPLGLAELLSARTRLPQPITALRPEVPASLEAAIMSALDPAPTRRPASAAAWLRAIRSAGVQSDPEAVRGACEGTGATVSLATRTVAPGDVTPMKATATVRPRRRLVVASAVLLMVVAATVALNPTSVPLEPSRAIASPGEPLRSVLRRRLGEAHATACARRNLAEARAAPLVNRRTAEPSAMAPRRAPSPPHRAHTPPPRIAPAELRLDVRATANGPIHVSGAGVRGLAPQRSAPLAAGAHVLEVRGALPAIVRITRSDDRLFATIGAPPGRYYDVSCGGKAPTTTPLMNVPLATALTCHLASPDGAVIEFTLAPVRP